MKIRILIADDQTVFANGLKSMLLFHDPNLEVVGIASTGEEAVRLARELSPDLILLDVVMPNLNGVEAVERILAHNPEQRILMLTTFDDDRYVKQAIQKGALGYFLKDFDEAELLAAIHSAFKQNVILSSSVAKNLLRDRASDPVPRPAPGWLSLLNSREKDVARCVVEGCNNFDISRRLNLGEQTVCNYISSIYNKAGIHDRYMIIRLLDGVEIDSK